MAIVRSEKTITLSPLVFSLPDATAVIAVKR
jgi:hypothetical protein